MKNGLLAFFCCFTISGFGQSFGDLPPNAAPGKCYEKCLMPDQCDFFDLEVPVYIGEPEDTTVKREWQEIILQNRTSKWVKKKADRNCLSADPEDCLVWCLIEVPEESIQLEVVLDKSDPESFIMEIFQICEPEGVDNFSEWREILCADKVTRSFIRELQIALIEEGYLEEKIRDGNPLDSETKEALKLFQRENDLPVGGLNLETLDALNINY